MKLHRLVLPVVVLLLASAPASNASAQSAALLHPMFQDHAVLQRDAPIRVYGVASAGERITVRLGEHTSQVTADADGRWEARLPALPAGGPYVLAVEATDGREQRVEDVLIGDVWLCSGQSNMVLEVHRALDSRAEVAAADTARIRLLRVGETGSTVALDTFATPVQWLPTTPETVGEFSATCYFYARELQKTIDVPMGLVVAAWGGSRIQPWISPAALQARGDLAEELAVLRAYGRDPAAGSALWGELWGAWWRARSDVGKDDAPWRPDYRETGEWADAPPSLGAWERWNVPELTHYDGMLWYRTRVRLSRAQARQSAVLELGAIDETDMTWVNGRAVGSTYGPGQGREYALPTGLLRAGDNTVVINVLDTYRDGGLAGPQEANALRFGDGSRVVLDGGWRWRATPGFAWPPSAPWHTTAGLSTLYNGMIAPIGRYGFRGVLWYQGESNTGEAATYGSLLGSLISDWRQRFDSELPWLNVQLAGYGAAPTTPAESGWAALREVQRRHREHDPRYGIATAVDLGDRYDIHPANKQEVGRRLARLARHLVYDERELAPTGPQPMAALRDADAIVLRFADVSAGLVAYGAEYPIGFELCVPILPIVADGSPAIEPARKASSADAPRVATTEAWQPTPRKCRYADARIDGNTVRLRHADASLVRAATHVRHAWADNPVITLFDAVGLPVQPFEIPIDVAEGKH